MENKTTSSSRGGEEEAAKVPLLEPRAAADHHGRSSSFSKVEQEEVEDDDSSSCLSLGRRAWEENKKLWVVAGPSIFTRFSSFGVTVISQAFIGHIGATELAAYALVSTVLMRFSNGILVIY
jgi:MATE family multidrug resistance protein